MKPKPFWPLNHFTVPCDMGALPSGAFVDGCARAQPVRFEIWGEGRQSGALFAARPSRSAESSNGRDMVLRRQKQGLVGVTSGFTRNHWLFVCKEPMSPAMTVQQANEQSDRGSHDFLTLGKE
jgi:hypothetical protein